MGRVLNAIAAAYRGELDSSFLPAPHLERGVLPWQLPALIAELPAEAVTAADSQEALELLSTKVQFFCIFANRQQAC